MPHVLTKYRKEVVPALRKEFGYKTAMAVPKIIKVVLNVGVGRIAKDEKLLSVIERDLALIAGQKPAPTFAKKSIASFKLREGMKIGYKITLRGKRMYDFIDRLINVALPRMRDFRGLNPKSFDGKSAYNIGITEHSIFPEIHYESLREVFSLEIAVVTSARQQEEAAALLRLIGFPFKT